MKLSLDCILKWWQKLLLTALQARQNIAEDIDMNMQMLNRRLDLLLSLTCCLLYKKQIQSDSTLFQF